MVYADDVWRLDDTYIDIGEFWNFLGGHREVFVNPRKEVFAYLDYGVGAQEVICGASNYYNVIGGVFLKGIKSMVFDMLGEA